jgi:hypothetical protein
MFRANLRKMRLFNLHTVRLNFGFGCSLRAGGV